MTDEARERTRKGLHAVAELVLAGPQYRMSGTIRLRVVPDGIATVAAPDLRLDGADLLGAGLCVAISGATPRSLGDAFGVDAGAPSGLYGEGSGTSLDAEVILDPRSVREILEAFQLGSQAFAALAPGVEPVLWPEHFDLGIRLADVNYGVSAGDAFLAEPYAYIGVEHPQADEYWNAPFGAARPVGEFADAAELVAFLADGRRRWEARPPAG